MKEDECLHKSTKEHDNKCKKNKLIALEKTQIII